MQIWLITVGEPLPTDEGVSRLLRTGILADMLNKEGHTVTWWNSTFDHSKKKHRADYNLDVQYRDGYLIRMLHGCGYSSNISLKRIWDHILVANQFRQLAKSSSRPDIILCSLPTLELSQAAVSYGKRFNVPVVIDVRDLWPDLFLDYVPRIIKPIFNLFLMPMWFQARYACRGARGITASSPYFVNWGLKLAGREPGTFDKDFPFGYVSKVPTSGEIEEANNYWSKLSIDKSNGEFTLCFFGTLGAQFDLATVIESARILESKGKNVKFVICGAGDSLEDLRKMAIGLKSVVFPGWVGANEIWSLMRIADVGLAPYFNNAGFSENFPNKTIEYLSAGLPIISSLQGYFKNFLKEVPCGITYNVGDAESLADIIFELSEDKDKLLKMSHLSQNIFDQKFKAEKVYGDMIEYLKNIAK